MSKLNPSSVAKAANTCCCVRYVNQEFEESTEDQEEKVHISTTAMRKELKSEAKEQHADLGITATVHQYASPCTKARSWIPVYIQYICLTCIYITDVANKCNMLHLNQCNFKGTATISYSNAGV